MIEFFQKPRCLIALRDLTRELGHSAQSKDLQGHPLLYESILHHFGSLKAARRAAGVSGPDLRRRWSANIVIKEIRRLYAHGIRISIWPLIEAGHRDLVHAARMYCGGIPRARILACVPTPPRLPVDREVWDPERVLEEIENLSRLKESLAYTRVPRKLNMAARHYFGSYRAAVEEAGFDYNAIRLVREQYTREDLILAIRAVRKRRPEMTLGMFHRHRISAACIREFGSLEAAARAAGLDHWPLRIIGPLLDEGATIDALRVRRREGCPITVTDLERDDPRVLSSAIRHFGDLMKAAARAGFEAEHKRKPRWTKDEIRAALQARWSAGLPMHPGALRQDEGRLYSVLKKRYGTISNPEVARDLGLPPGTMASRMTHWSPERVIAELQALTKGVERIRWKEVQPILKQMCRKYFGSMVAARAAAGLPEPRRLWTREQVIQLLQAQSPDVPYPRDLISAAQAHFGTWLAALDAAGIAARSRHWRRRS